MYKTETICRLCLQISESDFKIIDEIRKCLDALCLKIDLSLGKEPGMCKKCATVLQKSFDLMLTCQNTKDNKSFSVNENAIERCNNLNGSIINNKDYRTCQFCTQIVKKGFYLNQLEGDLVAMKDVLPNCFLDLYITAVEEPVLCELCHDSIQSHITFLKNWLEVEYKIKHYYEIGEIGSKDQIDLGDVLQYFLLQLEAGHTNLSLVNYDKSICQTENGITVTLQIKNEEIILPEHQWKTETDMIDITSGDSDVGKYQDAGSSLSKEPQLNADHSTQKKDLQGRMLSHEVISGPLYKCEMCDFHSKRKPRFRYHLLTHSSTSQVPLYKCEMCAFQTKYKHSIPRHKLTHKSASEVPLYKCKMCSHQTKYKGNLQRHMLYHKSASEVPLYKCETCPFQTKCTNSIHEHVLIHKNVSEIGFREIDSKSIRCKMCTFRTKHKSSIQEHILTHEDASHTCEICGHQTKLKDSLQQCMLIHKNDSGVVLYECKMCAFQTKHSKARLRRHMLSHKDASHICEICGHQTKFKASFNAYSKESLH